MPKAKSARNHRHMRCFALQLDFHTLALQDEVRTLVDERGGLDAMTAMDWQAGALPGWLLQHSPEPQYSEYRVVYNYDMPRNVRLLATRQHNAESGHLQCPFTGPSTNFRPHGCLSALTPALTCSFARMQDTGHAHIRAHAPTCTHALRHSHARTPWGRTTIHRTYWR
jgi:hypothetical protein